jgi:hypothetical protein
MKHENLTIIPISLSIINRHNIKLLTTTIQVHLQMKRKGTDGDSQAGDGDEESEPMLTPPETPGSPARMDV